MTTAISITKKLFEVGVRQEYNGKVNVVHRVRWGLVFRRDTFEAASAFETFLPVEDLSNFISIENLSKEQVLNWAYQHENGDVFIERFLPYQEQQLTHAALQAGITVYPNFDVDAQADHGIPVEIL
jgi:hypothetical protein